jgi:hypothetical protein
MKPNRIYFIISLVVIVLLSIADNRYFAFSKPYNFSPVTRQLAHFTIFFITAGIGYLNWKAKERWLLLLWIAMYAIAFVFIAAMTVITYFLTRQHYNAQQWINIMAVARQTFLGPIPFLVFYLLSGFIRQMAVSNKG